MDDPSTLMVLIKYMIGVIFKILYILKLFFAIVLFMIALAI
jgi:hypothetical protein